ncbi:MAG TPA: sulfatase-like hydrolase/transferase [Enhygromyxa sp.]|nr:sulfatase-like hydrolase/transferase [Enhygromyxa sp.]
MRRSPLGWAALCLMLVCLSFACTRDGSSASEGKVRPAAKPAPVSKVESTDAWQDLIAQRPSAVLLRDGRVWIDLGHPSAQKHLQLAAAASPWRLAQDIGDRRAAILVGQTGALDIPLDGPLSPKLHPDKPVTPVPGQPVGEEPPPPERGLALAITLRALAPDQSVTVLWEERPLANLRVSQDWERRTLSLPGDVVVTGENRLRLHFRSVAPLEGGPPEEQVAAAVESVEVGTLAAIKAGPPSAKAGAGYAIAARGEQVEFEVPAGMSLVYYVLPPRRSRLSFEVSGRGSIEVLASTDADHLHGRRPAVLLQEPLRASGRTSSIDLSGYGGIPMRLELRVTSSRERAPGEPPGGALFRAIDIVAHRSIPIDRRDRKTRDVYVLALEGVRPDDLLDGAFGQLRGGPRYEHVERFLSDALLFERAYALGAAAVPSHAGMLTSVIPLAHLTVRGTYVAEGQRTLAELLDRAGYYNSNISANSYFTEDRGLTQGFANHVILERSNTRGNDAEKVTLAMLEEIEQRPRPRFIYAVLNDAQAPYDPPSEELADVTVPVGAPAQHRTHMWIERVRTGVIELDPAHLTYVRRLYRGELQVIDKALGQLLAALGERNELDDAVIVLVGIHGEEFLEHGGTGHGRTLFEESIHVPLAIRAPKLLAPGRVEAPVDLLDLGPTLADLLGVEFDPQWQGESLVPLIDDPQPPPRLVVSYLGDGSRAAIIGHHKFVLGPGRGRESQHFYDLEADPGEQHDRIAEGGIALRVVRTALSWQMPEQPWWKRPRWGTGANLQAAFALDHGL